MSELLCIAENIGTPVNCMTNSRISTERTILLDSSTSQPPTPFIDKDKSQ